jgi:hypothetical protein
VTQSIRETQETTTEWCVEVPGVGYLTRATGGIDDGGTKVSYESDPIIFTTLNDASNHAEQLKRDYQNLLLLEQADRVTIRERTATIRRGDWE